MSSVLGAHAVIDKLIQSSLENEHNNKLEWVSNSDITDIKPCQIDNVYYAIRKQTRKDGKVKETMIMLLSLGKSEECTPTLVSEFARIYSLPTHKYRNDVSQFRRYSAWLMGRNSLIKGFTKYDDNYYMVAYEPFYDCYSRY